MNKLENIFGKKLYSKRFQIFLCDILSIYDLNVDHKALQNYEIQNSITYYLERNQALISQIDILSSYFIDEFYFEWINDKNVRQMNFVTNKLQKINIIPKKIPPNTVGIHIIYLLIDTLPPSVNSKIEIINSIKSDWNNHLGHDKIFRWFREDGKSKFEFTWDWLCKRKPVMTEKTKPFECFTDILIFFDEAVENYVERNHYIEIIKRNWKQHTYRNKLSSKKQCNILLSNNTINIIDELCDHYRLKKQELIEILILSEHQNRTHLKQIDPLPTYHSENKVNNTKTKKA